MKTLSIFLAAGAAGAPIATISMPAMAADATIQQGDAAISSSTDAVGSTLEDIVVTGRKRARSEALQETPVSITALTSTQLERAVAKDLTDVGRMTLICPLRSGPETMIVWTTKGTSNAKPEAQAGRDYRQAA